jgi:hypothetical protein
MVLGDILQENANVELTFKIQDKIKDGNVPDATITQASFKIVVETKLYGQFDRDQLKKHLKSFDGSSADYKVLLTVDPSQFPADLQLDVNSDIAEANRENQFNIIHKHITFDGLIKLVGDVLDQRDYEMNDIVDDFREFCAVSGLLKSSAKTMCVRTVGTTVETNLRLNLYYDVVSKTYTAFDYLGLYDKKTVLAVGKITAVIIADMKNGKLKCKAERGDVTPDIEARIIEAINESDVYNYNLSDYSQRYFFVDKFYETDFKKISRQSLRKAKFFDLFDILGVNKLPETAEIAKLLKNKTWE